MSSFAVAADEPSPYAMTWDVTRSGRSVTFAMVVSDTATGGKVLSPRINTQTSFEITGEPEGTPGTSILVRGKPLDGQTWTLTLRATRNGSVIQETSYTAPLP